jgi:hypothetical protein
MRRDPQQNTQSLYDVASSLGGYFTAQALAARNDYSQQHYHFNRVLAKIQRESLSAPTFSLAERGSDSTRAMGHNQKARYKLLHP